MESDKLPPSVPLVTIIPHYALVESEKSLARWVIGTPEHSKELMMGISRDLQHIDLQKKD